MQWKLVVGCVVRSIFRLFVFVLGVCVVLGVVYHALPSKGVGTADEEVLAPDTQITEFQSEIQCLRGAETRLFLKYGAAACAAYRAYGDLATIFYETVGETEEALAVVPDHLKIAAIVGSALQHPELADPFVAETKASRLIGGVVRGVFNRVKNVADNGPTALFESTGTFSAALEDVRSEYPPHVRAFLLLSLATKAPGSFADQFRLYPHGYADPRGSYVCEEKPLCVELSATKHFTHTARQFFVGGIEDFERYRWEKVTAEQTRDMLLDAAFFAGGFWKAVKLGKTAKVTRAGNAAKALKVTKAVAKRSRTTKAMKVAKVGLVTAGVGFTAYNAVSLARDPIGTLVWWGSIGKTALEALLPSWAATIFGPIAGMFLLFGPIVGVLYLFFSPIIVPLMIGGKCARFVRRVFRAITAPVRWLVPTAPAQM